MDLHEIEERVAVMNERVSSLEAEVERLSGEHVHLIESTIGPTGEETEGPHADIVVGEGPPPGSSVMEWVSKLTGSPGIVLDEAKALAAPCIKIELGEGRRPLVYSHGIIGALDEEQQTIYCQQGYSERPITTRQQERLTILSQGSKRCSAETVGAPPDERLKAYFSCLARELKANGQEAW